MTIWRLRSLSFTIADIAENYLSYIMNQTKTYLNVSYAQKDAVKALGARWDPVQKKWYVPANIDLAAFEAWRLPSGTEELDAIKLHLNNPENSVLNQVKHMTGVITFPVNSNFVAYDGDKPPWE